MNTSYRQGDVLLLPVAALPATAQPKKAVAGRHILAMGEVTGHAHYIPSLDSALYEANEAMRAVAAAAGVRETRTVIAALRIGPSGATLYHGTPTDAPAGPTDGDHAAIALAPGAYLVLTPHEYTDDADTFRRIAD